MPALSPSLYFTVLFSLFALRSLYILTPPSTPLPDCDEVFNYYEPLHFLLFGKGLQTWEYAPEYALRTAAFLNPLYLILSPLSGISTIPKPALFHLARLLLSLFTSCAEASLFTSLYTTLSPSIAYTTLLLLAPTAGMYHASASFLPSSLALTLTIFATAAHLNRSYFSAIFYGLLAVTMLGWPFVAILYIPLGLHSLYASYYNKHAKKDSDRQLATIVTLLFAVFTLVFFSFVAAVQDYRFYGKITIPNVNIFLYNAIGGATDEAGAKTGDELYGVEPAMYYVKNLVVNAALVPFLAAMYPVLYVVKAVVGRNATEQDHVCFTIFVPLLLWFGLLFSRPHKEERFLFPVYHLLAFGGAMTLDMVGKWGGRGVKIVVPSLIGLSAVLSFGRIGALAHNYGAPVAVYTALYDRLVERGGGGVNVCVGGEWHRFPSHFFLTDNASLRFVESGFGGQLPQMFTEGGSKVVSRARKRGPRACVNTRTCVRHVHV